MSLERYNDAVRAIHEKKFKDAMLLLAELLADKEPYDKIHYFLAVCYLNLDYPEDAEKEFELSLEENLSIQERVNVLLMLGYLNCKLKDFNKAINHLKACLKFDEKNSKAYSCLGYCFSETKDFKKALEFFKKGLELDKENINLKNSVGYTILELDGDVNEALSLINSAVQVNPKNPAFLDSLAWAHFKSNRFAMALDTIVQAKTFALDNKIINEHYKIIFEKVSKS